MNLIDLFSGKGYIGLVKEFIDKVMKHEEKMFQHEPGDMSIILHKSRQGDIQIMSYSNIENRVLRIIPDKEAEKILTK